MTHAIQSGDFHTLPKHRELFAQEERVSQLETSALRLDEYFTQLNNTSTQATLLLGFVLGIACNDGVLTAIGVTICTRSPSPPAPRSPPPMSCCCCCCC